MIDAVAVHADNPGLHLRILNHEVGEERIDVKHDGRHDLAHFERKIIASDLSGVKSLFDRLGKAKKARHFRRIERPSGACADAAAHRADVVTEPAFDHALDIAGKGIDVCKQIMSVKRRLGLHAVRIGGHHRIALAPDGFNKTFAKTNDGIGEKHQALAIQSRIARG